MNHAHGFVKVTRCRLTSLESYANASTLRRLVFHLVVGHGIAFWYCLFAYKLMH